MDYQKFWKDLIQMARTDPEYQRTLERVRRAEKDYLKVCEMLPQEQRRAIEDYISACDEQEDCMVILAYRLGIMEHKNTTGYTGAFKKLSL